MNEMCSLRLEETQVYKTPTWGQHLKHSSQLHRGCILTAQTCFPVENIHLISRHFPKRMCLSQSLCLQRTFAEKVPPSSRHQSFCSQTFLPQLLPSEKDSQADEKSARTCKMFCLCRKDVSGVRSFLGGGGKNLRLGLICVFRNVSLASTGCSLWLAQIHFSLRLPSPPKNSIKNNLYSLVAQMVKKICLQCRRPRLDPWVGKIPRKGNGNPF